MWFNELIKHDYPAGFIAVAIEFLTPRVHVQMA